MRSYCLAAWHEMRTHGGHTRIQTPQQRSMGKARARAYLRATVPDMILIVVHHPQNVCVYMWRWRWVEGRAAPYTSQPDNTEHRGIHLSPTLTPLGFTSTPLSIIQRQTNYGLESEPSIARRNAQQLG